MDFRVYYLLLVFGVLSACGEGKNGLTNISSDQKYSIFIGKTYCLSQDMQVLHLLQETRYPQLEKYSLRDNLVSYISDPYFSTVMVQKGTKVTFKEVWTIDDVENENMHGLIWFVGEISDNRNRDAMVDLSILVGGRSTPASFNSKIRNDLVYECS